MARNLAFEIYRQALRIFGWHQLAREPGPLSMPEALQMTFARIEANYDRGGDGEFGITSGLEELDRAVRGWRPGELVVFAGDLQKAVRPLLVQFLLHVGLEEQVPCALLSPWQATDRKVAELLYELSGVARFRVETGMLSKEEWAALIEVAGRLSGATICWDDTPWASLRRLAERCQMLVEREGVAVVFIDAVQWLWRRQSNEFSLDKRASECMRSLKEMAVALEIPVICFDAKEWVGEEQGEERTALADIEGADAIVEWADEVYLASHIDEEDSEGALLDLVKTRASHRHTVWLESGAKTGSFRR